MQNLDTYICYLKPVSKKESELLSKYWELNDDYTYPFRFKLWELAELFEMKNQNDVSKFSQENSFISSNSPIFKCFSCGLTFTANNRSKFLALLKQKQPDACKPCQKKIVNQQAITKFEHLNASRQKLSLPTFYANDFQNLSYLSKIALCTMLLEVSVLGDQPLPYFERRQSLSDIKDFDEKILIELDAAGAFHEIKGKKFDETHLLYEARHHFGRYENSIDDAVIQKFNDYLDQIQEPGIYSLVPENFKNFEEFRTTLYEQIMCTNLSESDIESIKEFVINNRLNQAYVLINITIQKTKVPIDFNTRLESVLISLVRNYSLSIAFNIITYQALLLASELYSKPDMPYCIQDKLLAKKIEDQMKRVERLEKSSLYTRTLPNTMVGSKIEDFTSYYILDSLTSWTDLSADEVIEKWLNSPTITTIN